MSTILDFDAIQARLAADVDCSGFFAEMAPAWEMNPLEDSGDMPALYFYPGYIDADPLGDGSVRQLINNTVVFDVICKVTDLNTAVGHLRDAMLGWEMDQYHGPFQLAAKGYMQNQACGVVDIRGGVIHWQERYLNTTHTKLIHN